MIGISSIRWATAFGTTWCCRTTVSQSSCPSRCIASYYSPSGYTTIGLTACYSPLKMCFAEDLLFSLLRRNVHPILAASGAAYLMLLGPAWQDLLWPFQVCFLGSVAGGLAALYLSPRNSRYSDIAVALCSLVAVCCCALGVAFSVVLIVGRPNLSNGAGGSCGPRSYPWSGSSFGMSSRTGPKERQPFHRWEPRATS